MKKKEKFIAELKAVLEKYKASIKIDTNGGWHNNLYIELEYIYDSENNMIQEGGEIKFDSEITFEK